MKVKDCMCGEVCWVKPDTKVYEVAKIMNQNHIGCVPVCDDQNTLVGIITDRDIILRGVACDKDVKTTNASDIMTCNKVIGMLTLGDLSHYYEEIGEDYFCNTVENICECGGQAKNNY